MRQFVCVTTSFRPLFAVRTLWLKIVLILSCSHLTAYSSKLPSRATSYYDNRQALSAPDETRPNYKLIGLSQYDRPSAPPQLQARTLLPDNIVADEQQQPMTYYQPKSYAEQLSTDDANDDATPRRFTTTRYEPQIDASYAQVERISNGKRDDDILLPRPKFSKAFKKVYNLAPSRRRPSLEWQEAGLLGKTRTLAPELNPDTSDDVYDDVEDVGELVPKLPRRQQGHKPRKDASDLFFVEPNDKLFDKKRKRTNYSVPKEVTFDAPDSDDDSPSTLPLPSDTRPTQKYAYEESDDDTDTVSPARVRVAPSARNYDSGPDEQGHSVNNQPATNAAVNAPLSGRINLPPRATKPAVETSKSGRFDASPIPYNQLPKNAQETLNILTPSTGRKHTGAPTPPPIVSTGVEYKLDDGYKYFQKDDDETPANFKYKSVRGTQEIRAHPKDGKLFRYKNEYKTAFGVEYPASDVPLQLQEPIKEAAQQMSKQTKVGL